MIKVISGSNSKPLLDTLSSYYNNKSTSEVESDTSRSKSVLSYIHSWRIIKCCSCKHFIRVPMSCKDRLCQICRHHSGIRVLSRYYPYFQMKTDLKHLILTMKSEDTLTSQMVRTLRNNFHKLRRRKYFKSRIKGGLYFIETTLTTKGWHLHLHSLISTPFLDQKILSDTWSEITEGSFIVYIRKMSTLDQALQHLLLYFHKIPDVWPREADYNSAFSGVRLLEPFGDCRGFYNPKIECQCPKCGGDHAFTHAHVNVGIVNTVPVPFLEQFRWKKRKFGWKRPQAAL